MEARRYNTVILQWSKLEYKFEKVRELLSPIHLEINVRSKNIGDIAREVRTLKDQSHYITVSTPHKKMATFMIEANF